MSGWRSRLEGRLASYDLDESHLERLKALVEALAAERRPPTTVREPAEIVDRHIADSLVALSVPDLRAATTVADLGSGVGFPGLALAAAMPAASVDLVESARRKAAVIERLGQAAGIDNASAVPARAEAWAAGERRETYDVLTARALARLPVVVEYAAPLLRVEGALVVWRGAREPLEERAGDEAARELGLDPGQTVAVKPFPRAHSRHLRVYGKREPTPARFPRRPGVALKRPLA